MTRAQLLQLTLDCGAAKAADIRREQVVLSAEFRRICETNQCGCYGRCWMCPPDAGDIEVLMRRVKIFDGGILYQSIGQLEDSFDIEGMLAAGQAHAQLSQRIHAALPAELRTRVLHLSCGGCRLCEKCAKPQPCRFPDRALLSLEGCGIDVYNTTRSTPLRYINGQNTVTYFGLVLLP